jgi:hypothetical protein
MSDQTAAPAAPEQAAPTPAPAPAAPERHKLKVNGQEREYTIDELKTMAAKAGGADEMFRQSAAMRKEKQELEEKLKKDPYFFVKHPEYGPSIRKAVEDAIYEEIDMQKLSPAERRVKELEREKAEREKDDMTAKEKREAEQQHQLREKFAVEIDRQITDALSKSDLPKTPNTVSRMAAYMKYAVQNDIPVTQEDMVCVVYEDYMQEFKALMSAVKDDDALERFFDPDTRKRLRELDLKALRTTAGDKFKQPSEQPNFPTAKPKSKKMTGHDWRQNVMKDFLGK